jgi:hypothetical protein
MQRRAFHPALDFVVQRPFVHGEFSYAPGDPFPKEREFDGEHATGGFVPAGQATKDHIPERLLRQLWEQYRIDCVPVAKARKGSHSGHEGSGGTDAAKTPVAPVSEPLAGTATDGDPAHVLQTIAGGAGADSVTASVTELDPSSVCSLNDVLSQNSSSVEELLSTLVGGAGDDTITVGGGEGGEPSNEAPTAPTVEQASADAVSQTVGAFAKPYGSKHKGFGKYEVTDAAGVVVAEGLTKAAAAELVAANQ